MLPKSLLVGLEQLRPKTISNAILIRELLETTVCYHIRRCLINSALDHLPVSYNYDQYKLNNYNLNLTDFRTTELNYGELRTIGFLIERQVETTIEEFNLYIKHKPNKLLNFNSCLMNSSNLLITSEVLNRGPLC